MGIPKSVLYNRLRLNPMKTISLSEAQAHDYIASIGGRVLYSEREDGSNYDSTTHYVVRELNSAASTRG